MSGVDRRLLFVHAHPDDESSKGAATAARYVDEGATVVLVTCTGGEAGEVLNRSYGEEVSAERIPTVRRDELARAVAIIGFARAYQLGYRDSGWYEDLDDVPQGTFFRVDLDESAARLAAIVRHERPHVVVTYPADGGYPHPDHIRTHEVTMRALELAAADGELDLGPFADGPVPAWLEHLDTAVAWRVPKVYASTVYSFEKIAALHQAHLDEGLDSPFVEWVERARDRPPPPIAARIDVARWFDRRDEALRAHATQVDPGGFWFQASREIERRVAPWEEFVLLRSDVAVDPPEHDLFEGLAVAAAPGSFSDAPAARRAAT